MKLSALSGCTEGCIASWSTKTMDLGLEFNFNQYDTERVRWFIWLSYSKKNPKIDTSFSLGDRSPNTPVFLFCHKFEI